MQRQRRLPAHPSASKVTIVGVDFIPAVVKLTLNASPSSGPEMSANGDTPVAGTDPISPFYCGAIGEPQFPCTALARLYTDVTVQADNAGNLELGPANVQQQLRSATGGTGLLRHQDERGRNRYSDVQRLLAATLGGMQGRNSAAVLVPWVASAGRCRANSLSCPRIGSSIGACVAKRRSG